MWNVIFDFSGGLLSLTQLYFDCLDMNDFSGILGNWAKFVLSLITLVFDVSLSFFDVWLLWVHWVKNENNFWLTLSTDHLLSPYFCYFPFDVSHIKGILFLQHYVLFRNNITHSSSGYSLNDAVSEDEGLYTTMVETNEDGEEILTEFVWL